jgi:Flp pilus assembly protein TadG
MIRMHLGIPRWVRRFGRDARGVSAVEFALVLPLMVTMYLGASEVSQAITASRKVTLVSRTVADLASQSAGITNASMTNILNASAAVAAPFPSAKLTVTVSQVKIDANSNATIEWSDTLHGTKHGTGASVTLPAALNVANTWLIWTEAEYSYEPTFGSAITGTLALKDQMYMRPRVSNSVTRSAS